jgi:CheY-like chemotaxis protein
VRSIVDEMNGCIELKSAPNQGTTIAIRFEKCETPSGDSTDYPAVGTSNPDRSSGRKILIIDDEQPLLSCLREFLSRHDVTATNDGREAIELIREHDYEIVFCDIVMPTTSGWDVLRESSEFKNGIHERFVFMSGGCQTPDLLQRIAATNTRFLAKPFRMEDVESIVAQIECGV